MKLINTFYLVTLLCLVACGVDQDFQTDSLDDSVSTVESSGQNASFAIHPKRIVSVVVTGSTANPHVQQSTQGNDSGADSQVTVPSIGTGSVKRKIPTPKTPADQEFNQDLQDSLTGVCIGLGCAAGGIIISRATGMVEPGLMGLAALGLSSLKLILVPTDKTPSGKFPY